MIQTVEVHKKQSMKDVDLSKLETDKVDKVREVMKDYEEIFTD